MIFHSYVSLPEGKWLNDVDGIEGNLVRDFDWCLFYGDLRG